MKITDLRLKQILLFCKSCLNDYQDILSKEDLEIIKNYQNNEDNLLKIAKKIWDYELNTNEYLVISWNKYTFDKKKRGIVFATISKKDEINAFCNLDSGTILHDKIQLSNIINDINQKIGWKFFKSVYDNNREGDRCDISINR